MCGLAVAITLDKDPNLIKNMNLVLKHRGPDKTSTFKCIIDNYYIHFGFHRLAITGSGDETNQPMVSASGQYVLVFNGEIYNYKELREKFKKLGSVFISDSDSEVLIHGYEKIGIDILNLIDGMFSFILLDTFKGTIVAARDRFGEKPLYYSATPNGEIFFASEKKSIWQVSKLKYNIDLEFIGSTLLGSSPFQNENTNFNGIKQLEPGSFLEFKIGSNQIKRNKFWDPKFVTFFEKEFNFVENSHVLENLLFESVKSRIPPDHKYSLSLSGGIDSSLLAALILKRSDKKFENSFSVVFPNDNDIDESVNINLMAKMYDIRNIKVKTSAKDAVENMRSMHWHHEDIVPGLSMYLEWSLMKTVSNFGYKIIISGQGADELIGGYSHIFPYFLSDKLWINHIPTASKEFFLWVIKNYKNESLPPILKQYISNLHKKFGFSDIFEKDLRYLSLPYNLHGGDRSSMAFGIEQRHPYLSNAIVDFCLTLPLNAFVNSGNTKPLLKKVGTKYLPKSITNPSKKIGYAAPDIEWMKDLLLRNWIIERIESPLIKNIAGYDSVYMNSIYTGFKNGNRIDSQILWKWASAVELIDIFG